MKDVKRIENLLDEKGQVLHFPVFQSKYSLKKTSFLHYFQVIFAIYSRSPPDKSKIQGFNI